MGYTHYWYRKEPELDRELFRQFSEDCAKVCRLSEIPLASFNGSGFPEFTPDAVSFNGVENCGHDERDLGITWPSPTAKGVSPNGEASGKWFAVAMLEQRTCGGDCSHESFVIPRIQTQAEWAKTEREIFSFCKTAYKPYDILVTACLIIYQHYFGDQVRVSSDGASRDWEDARQLCQSVLGYGKEFQLPLD